MVKDQPDASGCGARTMFILGAMSAADSEPRREQVVLAPSTPTLRQRCGNCGWVDACPALCPPARPPARGRRAVLRIYNFLFALFCQGLVIVFH